LAQYVWPKAPPEKIQMNAQMKKIFNPEISFFNL